MNVTVKHCVVEGVTEKAGRMIEGVLHGDDIVKFRMRLTPREQLLSESVEFLDSEEGIAAALHLARCYGHSLKDGVRIIDEIRESLEKQAQNDPGDKFSQPMTMRLKGSNEAVIVNRYCGTDATKEGRVYLQGEILDQEVLIPAEHPKSETTKRDNIENAIRNLLPVSRFGQFMFLNMQALNLVRIVRE